MVTRGTGIRRVHWRYGYARAGILRPQARLCAAGRCVDADTAFGYSDAFAGLPVATAFRLFIDVPGTGRIEPGVGPGNVQIIVDFD